MWRAILLAVALAWTHTATAAEPCPPAKTPPITLVKMREALANNREVTIVALGSSSTEGSHSTDLAHSYPALLQNLLSAALPAAHIAVLNRGVGGEDVTEMLPRIERDVIGAHPTVVIWQVGANGAMRHVPAELFGRLLISGVHRLHAAGLEVVLMDNQRAPAILASPHYERFDQVMTEVAARTGATLFDRGVLMDQWRAAGFPYARFMADDGIHHNDYGYRCVAAALAQSLLDGLAPLRTAGQK